MSSNGKSNNIHTPGTIFTSLTISFQNSKPNILKLTDDEYKPIYQYAVQSSINLTIHRQLLRLLCSRVYRTYRNCEKSHVLTHCVVCGMSGN